MFNNAIKTVNSNKMLEKGDKVIVALSGGVDSMALLFFLLEIKDIYDIQVSALHLNHMLRGDESDRDLAFVTKYCNNRSVHLLIYNKDVKSIAKDLKISVEEAGREARREAYKDGLRRLCANKIATAHNKNDQAETFLFRLARGTGINGMRCIEYINGSIIRPLLDCGKNEIESYANENNIPFVTDSSNYMEIYDRNKIRLNLLPWIGDNLNPNIVNTLANTAAHIKEQTDYLNKQAEEAYKACLREEKNGGVMFETEPFVKLDIAVRKLVVRLALLKVCGGLKDIGAVHVNSVVEIAEKPAGKKAVLPGGIVCLVQYGCFVIKSEIRKEPLFYGLALNVSVYIKERKMHVLISDDSKIIKGNVKKLCTKDVKCDKIFDKACFRTRMPGDKIRLNGGTKKLKKYFIDEKIPREERDAACLIVINDQVVSVLNVVDAVTKGNYTYYLSTWEDTDG